VAPTRPGEPAVSVVIPAYNQDRFLGTAIRSVLEQTLPPDEVIVVDDGSTDGTGDVLAAFGDSVVVVGQVNSGVSAARNAGVARASGSLIAFLDADDVWVPAKLERQVDRFRRDPDLGLVHTGVQHIDEGGAVTGANVDGLDGWVSREMLLLRRPVVLEAGSTAVVPRRVFEALGGFDTRLSTAADWDLSYRISRRHRVGFVPDVLVSYRHHGENMHSNVDSLRHDMLLAFEKAFSEDPEVDRATRRRAYARLHLILSGSYAHVPNWPSAIRHGALAVALVPSQLSYMVRTRSRRRSQTLLGGGA